VSTISTTITNNIYYGSGEPYPSPLTITNTGAVISTTAGKTAVRGSGGGTLINYGGIIASGQDSTGVLIGSPGGSVTNTGDIQGYIRGLYIDGAGYVTNSGTILATGTDAGEGVAAIGGGTVTNTGTIINEGATGDGVQLDAGGGTVSNAGLIQAASEAVGMEQSGYVYNKGIIRSTGTNGDAVFQGRGGGTLINRGTIITNAAGGNGVLLDYAGGTVNNSGLIQAYDYGVRMEGAGYVANSGTILSTGGNGRAAVQLATGSTLVNTGSIIANQSDQAGVEVLGSGTVVNSALIEGYFTGLEMSQTGVVINSGVIHSLEPGFIEGQADVMMPYGGTFTNTQAGYINHGVFLNVASDGVGDDSTLVNAGTITGGVVLSSNNSFFGGIEYVGTGTVFDSGTISGDANEPFAVYFGGTNALLALEHGYAFSGAVKAGGTYTHTIELLGSAGADVTVNFNPTSFTNFGTVGFASGSGNYGTLALAGSADIPGTISGFTGLHDVVDLGFISDTLDNATAVLNPLADQLTVTGDNGSTVLQLATGETYPPFQAVPDASGNGTGVEVICFCRDTRILTDHGEVAVENLQTGDRVILHDGRTVPIVWIGEGRVLATRGRRSATTPVIVRKGALADNVPNRDLHVTKAHSLFIDDVLILVEFLVNHRSVVWDDRAEEVSLYHIELETHGVLLANGAPAESYRDDGNRWLFHNANSGWHLPPKPACAPVLTGGPVVDAIWRRLLDRSGPRHGLPMTDDPDLHLLVDGERLDAAWSAGGVFVFSLRRVPDCVRIVSRAAIPQELGVSRDHRSLGVALRRVGVRQAGKLRAVGANDALLADGFHPFEADNGFRWTTGDAVLPGDLFTGFIGPIEIVLTIASTTQYLDEGERLRVA
jgi:hypothetical protein